MENVNDVECGKTLFGWNGMKSSEFFSPPSPGEKN